MKRTREKRARGGALSQLAVGCSPSISEVSEKSPSETMIRLMRSMTTSGMVSSSEPAVMGTLYGMSRLCMPLMMPPYASRPRCIGGTSSPVQCSQTHLTRRNCPVPKGIFTRP